MAYRDLRGYLAALEEKGKLKRISKEVDKDWEIAAVCRQLARLIVQRIKDSKERKLSTATKIIVWNGPKGIDDAVRANIGLNALTISEWYANLEDEALEEVKRFWREMDFKP